MGLLLGENVDLEGITIEKSKDTSTFKIQELIGSLQSN